MFLQQIALVADADTRSDEGLVTLMTLHNAKGLEYPVVFITGCEDGVFPHSRAIDEGGLEEERRLFYVGITRAMRRLYLTHARRRAVFGAQTYGLRSRFLDEIPAELPGRAPGELLPGRLAVGRIRGRRRLRPGRPRQPAWRDGDRGRLAGGRGSPRAPRPTRSVWARTSCTPPSARAW